MPGKKVTFVRDLRINHPRKQRSPTRAPYPDEFDTRPTPSREEYMHLLRLDIAASESSNDSASADLLRAELEDINSYTYQT